MAVKLNRNRIPELVEILARYLPSSTRVHGLAMTAREGRWPGVTFWVDNWPDVKAILVVPDKQDTWIKYLDNVCSMFCVDLPSLVSVLETPDVIDWKSPLVFAAMPQNCWSILRDVTMKHQCQLEELTTADLYTVDGKDLPMVEIPEGLLIGELQLDQASTVSESWEHSIGEESVEFIQHLIKSFPSSCLHDSTGQPVAFQLMQHYGAMGMLYVNPEHRHKGYAKIVVSNLSQKIMKLGRTPYAYLTPTNLESVGLHIRMGFKKEPDQYLIWTLCKPLSHNPGACADKLHKRCC